ncbi:MAG: hypothetical protein PGN16_04290 [Sphingomonas phyllosphaerae]|uniref:hypothetical protein n=1 Tax=Sphingomonas phyllosphaerae TaxID=257003 RepID=UPI002FF8599D
MTDTGLTPFIVAMMHADPTAIARANPAKLAAKYGIRADHAAFYIRQWSAR